jgi:trans-2,3-dihydro-3-hydroxyanthranilate isomerase
LDLFVVSVFVQDGPLNGGNPLAVFPEAGDLDTSRMQAIARTMNLSETTFVTGAEPDGYDVRIFTPREELPFAGHPTIGTAWTLRHLGVVKADDITQRSRVGPTPVRAEDQVLWFERPGTVDPDVEATEARADEVVAHALEVDLSNVGLEARELGRSGRLRPATADAGVRLLMVPLRNVDALESCAPRPDLLEALSRAGVYCFTSEGAGRVRARAFFPGVGIQEDAATGSAAAALGLYLADRTGPIRFDITQGVEIGRPSRISVDGRAGSVRVGGRCGLILSGRLDAQ